MKDFSTVNPDAMSPRMKAKFAKYIPRKPAKGEALPNRIDIMHSPVYVPEKIESVRVGGDDHKLFASLMTGSDSTYKRHHP